MTRLTPEREAVISHLESVGEGKPSEIAEALGRSPGSSTRELLRGMARDGLLRTPKRGVYGLAPDSPPVDLSASPDLDPMTGDALTHEPDEVESRIGKPKPGQIFAYSAADGGMVPNDVIRQRKGYR